VGRRRVPARSAKWGTGWHGVPIEQSTTPPGSKSASRFNASSRSYGYGGGTKPAGADIKSRLLSRHGELGEAAVRRRGQTRAYACRFVVVHLDEHFSRSVQRGEHVAAVVRDDQ